MPAFQVPDTCSQSKVSACKKAQASDYVELSPWKCIADISIDTVGKNIFLGFDPQAWAWNQVWHSGRVPRHVLETMVLGMGARLQAARDCGPAQLTPLKSTMMQLRPSFANNRYDSTLKTMKRTRMHCFMIVLNPDRQKRVTRLVCLDM